MGTMSEAQKDKIRKAEAKKKMARERELTKKYTAELDQLKREWHVSQLKEYICNSFRCKEKKL